MIDNEGVSIRRVRFSDVKKLLEWENNPDFWRISDRKEALNQREMEKFIEEQQADVFDLDQIRYMIVGEKSGILIGTIDLYDIKWDSDTATVGILVAEQSNRKKGIGSEALQQLIIIAQQKLELEFLKARVHVDNTASLRLFDKLGFNKKSEEPDQYMEDGDYIQYFTLEKWLKK